MSAVSDRSAALGSVFGAGGLRAYTSGWALAHNPDRPVDPMPLDAVAQIYATSLRILAEVGVEFPNPDALAALRAAGCRVEGQRVQMDAEFLTDMLALVPRRFTLTPRNPAHKLPVGYGHMGFLSVASPGFSWDIERGKRPGDFATFQELVILSQSFGCIHGFGGYPVEPLDVPPAWRHIDCLSQMLTLSDKLLHAYALGAGPVEDAMEMVQLAAGLSDAAFRASPRMMMNVNSAAPLRQDCLALDGAMRMARAGQAVIYTPYTLAGATGPVTLAGSVALALAEALSMLALLQWIRPGAPLVIGAFVSNVDMRNGAPGFGTPDYIRATQMMGQMLRHLELPFRCSNVSGANVPDGQAMWESANALWSGVQSGASLIWHAAGWLEGGQIASPDKFVMDCEMILGLMRYMDRGLCQVTPETLAFDVIKEVGPGGSFFDHPHSVARATEAFYRPLLSDWRNYEAWAADGGEWTADRAHRVYKSIVADFRAPEFDHNHHGQMLEFAARRKEKLMA